MKIIKGDIYYGDVKLKVEKHRRRKMDNQIISTQRGDHTLKKMVVTMHEGKIIDTGSLVPRIKKRLPKHLNGWEITGVEWIDGVYLSKTMYDITPFLNDAVQ